MAPTSSVLLLRTAAHPSVHQSRLSSHALGPLRPILWVGLALGCMVSAPRRLFPVQCLRTAETDPVPRRPSPAVVPPANTSRRSIVLVPRRPSPAVFPPANTPHRSIVLVPHPPSREHHLPLTAGRPASHTLVVLPGP